MIVNVQHQANNHTARVQEETRGFQRAVQDNAEAIIAQRVNHEASRDEEYMLLMHSRDEEYVSNGTLIS
eukprot:1534957-Amphidinium_carterae.1